MATEFYITADNSKQKFEDLTYKGQAKTYSFDFTAWVEDNNDISSVTWTVKSGNAAVSGQSLTSNVASALIGFTDSGRSLIEIKATTSSEVMIANLDVVCRDLNATNEDYGMIVG